MKKHFFALLIWFATIVSSLLLVKIMRVESLAFAWGLNFLLMFWISIYVETQTKELNAPYYNAQDWERNGRIYENFGIHLFRQLLVIIGWEKLNKKSNPVEKNAQALAHNLLRTKKAELGHLIIFLLVLGVSIVVAWNHGLRAALWLMIFNIVLNFYPVILQRYNRPRIERALRLIERNNQRRRNQHEIMNRMPTRCNEN
ncbi:hypothetical protein [Undibacterium fentianense]|uniref:Glycosyl-4,4'-diaponeurosporenoate acyltransferase n=1 Tax=Undibacterium fentianense TaxID=2828728 RepID=A0A941E0X0_9BURK|nr:hypothetical protein [Undibacterium fentianense]MBR7799326.1 hypothetical protein [Undibacterium fentianense]